MPPRDDYVPMGHMLDHALEAMEMCRGRTRDELDRNRMLNLALVRLIEIVGEAANRISDDGKRRLSEVPWPQVISMRNRLIHGYDEVDLDILWDTVQIDLPPLIEAIKRQLGR